MFSCKKIYLPLDFNSLANLKNEALKLSDYYVDYAFSFIKGVPREGLLIIFYDRFWIAKEEAIPSLDASVSRDEDGSWKASINGSIYLSNDIPSRQYESAFIGSSSFLMENGQKALVQKLGDEPEKDVLGGVSCFLCAPGSEFPNFARIIGMNVEEVENFFTFLDVEMLPPITGTDGCIENETLIVRGGRNKNDY